MFFINGLLYTESRIRDRYNYQKDINVSYLFTHEILYCFISTVVSLIIVKAVFLLTPISDRLMFLPSQRIEKNKQVYKMVRKIQYKVLCLFLIISFSLLVYWYFLSLFCSVYRQNQGYLTMATFISILFSFVLSSLFCFIISIIRFTSIKQKTPKLYNVSLIMVKYL